MILAGISDRCFEVTGTICGLLASGIIASQVYAEWTTQRPSTLSPVYTVGFLLLFIFWTVYGVRFKRVAIWLPNGAAVCMQAFLLAAILLK